MKIEPPDAFTGIDLTAVSKPYRYLGGEHHAVYKDPASVRVRWAMAFPDLYEVGMSHLGMQILYHHLNLRPDVWAERVYAPWRDMADAMRAAG
ncbi:MAG: hypothetical protein KC466_13980, partial [Myxococcales bacterium]|nr:hypothetical protein [Myxococcales bacterium]